LARRLDAAGDAVLVRILRAVALECQSALVTHAPAIDAAVDRIANGRGDFGPELRSTLEGIARVADEAGWSPPSGESGETAFRQARLVAAIAFALDGDVRSAALEAIYEAYHGVTDRDRLLELIESALRSP